MWENTCKVLCKWENKISNGEEMKRIKRSIVLRINTDNR